MNRAKVAEGSFVDAAMPLALFLTILKAARAGLCYHLYQFRYYVVRASLMARLSHMVKW